MKSGISARSLRVWDVLVIVAIVFVFLMLFPADFTSGKDKATRIACVRNLKEIGTADRIWSADSALGGWKDILTNANLGYLTWSNYVPMSKESGSNLKTIVCPADERKPAKAFNDLSNLNVSYFVVVGAGDQWPMSIARGDRNLGPGNTPKNDYGFSPKDGSGNDVALSVTSKTNSVCWSLKMHSDGSTVGAGNILLGDGSAQQITSGNFCQVWLPNAAQTNNWPRNPGQTANWPTGLVPLSPSIRILFP
jgi:hypothetical protein